MICVDRYEGREETAKGIFVRGHVRRQGLIRAACGEKTYPERDEGTTLKTVSQAVDFGGILSTMISSSRDVCYCFSTAT